MPHYDKRELLKEYQGYRMNDTMMKVLAKKRKQNIITPTQNTKNPRLRNSTANSGH